MGGLHHYSGNLGDVKFTLSGVFAVKCDSSHWIIILFYYQTNTYKCETGERPNFGQAKGTLNNLSPICDDITNTIESNRGKGEYSKNWITFKKMRNLKTGNPTLTSRSLEFTVNNDEWNGLFTLNKEVFVCGARVGGHGCVCVHVCIFLNICNKQICLFSFNLCIYFIKFLQLWTCVCACLRVCVRMWVCVCVCVVHVCGFVGGWMGVCVCVCACACACACVCGGGIGVCEYAWVCVDVRVWMQVCMYLRVYLNMCEHLSVSTHICECLWAYSLTGLQCHHFQGNLCIQGIWQLWKRFLWNLRQSSMKKTISNCKELMSPLINDYQLTSVLQDGAKKE